MPLTAAEKQKRYRERIKNDPEKDRIQKRKDIDRIKKWKEKRYFEDFQNKIPRPEISQIEEILKNIIGDVDSDHTVTICGSYRRGKAESGDIDALMTHPALTSADASTEKHSKQLAALVRALQANGLVTDVLSAGKTKFMGVCRLSEGLPCRRLDIRLVPHSQYHCAVLYFTGSDQFNKTMRAHALTQGFTLNEYTLRPVGETGVLGEPVPVESEEDIFDYIDFPFKKPEERNM